MKRVAYAAANSLTVAGEDFPRHIWSAFFFFFLPQIFKCLGQTGVQQCRGLKHQAVALKSIKHLKRQLLQTAVPVAVGAVSALARLGKALNMYSLV